MGTVERKTGRLSHKALEICCCRMVNNSVFGGNEGRTYVQSRRQFVFFLSHTRFGQLRDFLPGFSQLPLEKVTGVGFDQPTWYIASDIPCISKPTIQYEVNIGPSIAKGSLYFCIILVHLDKFRQ